ncbi:MAG TPA: hypothetical protein QGF63_03860 [Alphaproteobacteria bacterium]|nr:hypothetical protein [Alphaproteobacteria bacterium]HJM48966.1 hypothetical protein [Alphaproteobacteria bacterium]
MKWLLPVAALGVDGDTPYDPIPFCFGKRAHRGGRGVHQAVQGIRVAQTPGKANRDVAGGALLREI